ncbi:MAG: sigma-54 dependent transcriptional regulator [Bryobacteraceae bacterium]|jgi:DNA-binding NtrC family response regulator
MSDTGALVYVVDDDVSAREGVARLIRSAGVMTKTFASGEEFLAAPRPKTPSCLVLDVNLPGASGLDVQQKLAESRPQLPIVFLTGHGDIPMTVRAVKAGAAEFLTKPVDDEALMSAIWRCITSSVKEDLRSDRNGGSDEVFEEKQDLTLEELYLDDEIHLDRNVGNMVGRGVGFQSILKSLQIVAPTDSTVLILGETGTGKELVAQAIHELSPRRKGSFVKVNCAAIPASLLESELFGHEKGSFTGAVTQKLGRFELAHKGTLFLDEIGEMPLELQSKLLRAIQDQEFERVGGTRTIRTDVRFVAATNRDLKAMVDEHEFRADLYYRLHVFPMSVPPLRERREDIPLLTRYFVKKHAQRMGRAIDRIPASAMEALTRYVWPGNIRELQNVLERSVILTHGNTLEIIMPDLREMSGSNVLSICGSKTSQASERQAIIKALEDAKGLVGGQSGAAARLGMKRTTLQSRMRKLNIARQYR